MTIRAYVDTSVVLRVAYDEGASPELARLVRNGTVTWGPVQVMLVAPVLSELFMKVVSERKEVASYESRIQTIVNEVRPKGLSRAEDRPRGIGRAEKEMFAAGLERQLGVIGQYPDMRRARIIDIIEDLKGHAEFSDLTIQDVSDAFAEEGRLLREARADSPGGPDLLILATIQRCYSSLPGVFLTCDRHLRDLAAERHIESPDPEKFANEGARRP